MHEYSDYKFCADCKHYKHVLQKIFWVTIREEHLCTRYRKVNLVTGEVTQDNVSAEYARYTRCGGNNWEAR